MKKILTIVAIAFTGFANAQDKTAVVSNTLQTADAKGTSYGKSFDETNSLSVEELIKRVGDREVNDIAATGVIEEVCQAEGCWIRVAVTDGNPMLVKFKDHAFVIPKDLAGKKVSFYGRAYKTTVSVKMLQHYAEDAGKSKEEIAKITEPSTEVAFEATGVVIK